jgi:hypothetical protein
VTIEHSSPSARRPISNCQWRTLDEEQKSPKGLICPARMPTIRGSISSRRGATLLRDCNCTCPFEDHLTSPLPLNRHRLRRLGTQLPEGARIAPGRPLALAWLRRAACRAGPREARIRVALSDGRPSGGPMAGATVTRYDASS